MNTLRRDFLMQAGALSMGSIVLADGVLHSSEDKPQAPPASMIFETILTEGVAGLSYLIGDKKTGQAAVIDPRRDIDIYVDLARKHKLTISHTLETHIHADLVSGCVGLADRTGTAKVCVSAEGGAKYGFPHQKLKEGDQINLGRVMLTARHTPGHTPEHMSYLVAESNHPEQSFAIFSGDCLFANSVGRPDLLGDDETNGLAKQLYESIYEFYLKLPDDLRVHPAHGAGSPCGANISDRLVTTIGYERKNNPALQFKDKDKFIEYVLFTAPPEPKYYPRVKKENAKGPIVLERLPTCPGLPPSKFAKAIKDSNAQLVDNRQMLSFGGGHIPGALNIGPRAELSIWAGWMLDPGKPVFLVLRQDTDLPEVQRQFIRVGFYKFGGYLLGGIEEWNNEGLPIVSMGQMDVHELNAALSPKEDLQILDVRTPGERQDGYIPSSTYIFLPELEKKAERLDKARPVAVYCDSGYRASLAASLLLTMGFKDVRNVPGSWQAWEKSGYEVQKTKDRKKGTETNLS